MRLIDADKLIELIDDDIASLGKNMSREGYDVCLCTLQMVKQYIRVLQGNATNTEQFENCGTKHGRWIQCTDVYSDGDYECSECRKREWNDTDYCPNCGARMIDEVEE